MLKQITITLDNTLSNQNADVVLFDALKNASHITNTLNTYQTGANACTPGNSIEGLFQLVTNIAKDYLVYFDSNGTMVFNLGKFIGFFKISLSKGSYFQLLEFLKTGVLNIRMVHVDSNISPLIDENWRVINTKENGETNEELLTGTKVITPYTVNASIGIFNVNKTITKHTSAVVKIRAQEKKTYTIFYS